MSSARRAVERFWFDVNVPPQVLRLFRLAFFAVLALDMWLEIAHAPRYGAGGFNVSHLPALDGILPALGRPAAAVLFGAGAALAALIAFGGVRRTLLVPLTALFGVFYFSSQLDSYQHHYLMFLVLVILCFADWGPASRGGWPLRLLLVQLSIVYFYAALSKLGPDWRHGTVLATQVSAEWARAFIERMGGFGRAAALVVFTELSLAVAIQLRALRPYAAAIGIPFHAFIELSGFHIGLFSYFMFALYVLMLPARPIVALVDWWDRASARVLRPQLGWVRAAILIVAGAVVMITLPVGAAAAGALAAALLLGGWAVLRTPPEHRPRIAAGHVVACLAVALIARPAVTESARDYYRYWGGSARRLGDMTQAIESYVRVVELDPDYAQGHTALANLYKRASRFDDALREAKKAQALAPDDHRPFLVEALVHEAAGRADEAIAAAEKALAIEPGNPDATRIVQHRRARSGGEDVE
jgi:tetratricopeptide (TPR) repeat protein